MNQTITNIALALILITTHVSLVQAQHKLVRDDISWFTSDTSSLLNRSSLELASKHVNRGIQFAYQALSQNLKPNDALIAYHNLCIGFMASDKPGLASKFCTHAREIANASYRVTRIRGAFRLQEINDADQMTFSAKQLIAINIQIQRASRPLALLAE